jgi:hypothetical protein
LKGNNRLEICIPYQASQGKIAIEPHPGVDGEKEARDRGQDQSFLPQRHKILHQPVKPACWDLVKVVGRLALWAAELLVHEVVYWVLADNPGWQRAS